jgi:TolB-like protein/class 3 adenylate cyclase/Flp pilus assembly protein TadD
MTDLNRKLATIVALDVAGFSARTEADEAKTIAQVSNLRPVIESIAKAHGGRVFNTAGDGFMLEFPSSLQAVEAALELAEECRPKVRVGVHIGDVVVQPNNDLLGHGVNVAARLMAKAEAGSAVISADVKRLIRGPLAERFVSRGPVQLDKMNETIEIFAPGHAARAAAAPKPTPAAHALKLPPSPQLAMIGGAALVLLVALVGWHLASRPTTPEVTTTAAPTTTTPEPSATSIAVLPFENLSTDKDNAFFAVGIQDEILTRLAKIGSLKVISRTSTSHLSSRPENLPEIAHQLGVANILEGSVQRQGDAVRVNVQLIKASSDEHLWAEIYDRKLNNIFKVQSEIAIAVAAALSAKVTGEENTAITLAPTSNTAAYDAYLRGTTQYLQNQWDKKAAEKSLSEAVRLDPEFALAWAHLSRVEAFIYFDTDKTPAMRNAARKSLENALRLQPGLAEAELAQGFYWYYVDRDYERARQQFELIQSKWPNNIESLAALGYIAKRQGRWDDSRSFLEKAIALDPLRTDLRQEQALVFAARRNFSAALQALDGLLAIQPGNASATGRKAEILQELGRMDEASALLKTLPTTNPKQYPVPVLVQQAAFERNYAGAIAILTALRGQNPDELSAAEINLNLCHLHTLSGDTDNARKACQQALTFYLASAVRQPDNSMPYVNAAWAYCLLGDRATALKNVEKAISLTPASRDALQGPRLEIWRARIWSMFGDRDLAIPELARLLGVSSGSPLTPATLRLDPSYDKLRGDPRFEALLK